MTSRYPTHSGMDTDKLIEQARKMGDKFNNTSLNKWLVANGFREMSMQEQGAVDYELNYEWCPACKGNGYISCGEEGEEVGCTACRGTLGKVHRTRAAEIRAKMTA